MLQVHRVFEEKIQHTTSQSIYLGQPATRTDREGCERLFKLSD